MRNDITALQPLRHTERSKHHFLRTITRHYRHQDPIASRYLNDSLSNHATKKPADSPVSSVARHRPRSPAPCRSGRRAGRAARQVSHMGGEWTNGSTGPQNCTSPARRASGRPLRISEAQGRPQSGDSAVRTGQRPPHACSHTGYC